MSRWAVTDDNAEDCVVLITEAPGEPKDVAIDKFDRSSVTLKWKPPNDDGGNPIKGLYEMLFLCLLTSMQVQMSNDAVLLCLVLCLYVHITNIFTFHPL